MKQYRVKVSITVWDIKTVEAEDEEEAQELAIDMAGSDSLNEWEMDDYEAEVL